MLFNVNFNFEFLLRSKKIIKINVFLYQLISLGIIELVGSLVWSAISK